MKIKEAVYDSCKTCNRRGHILSEEVYGCDTCKKILDRTGERTNGQYNDFLQVTVFFHTDNTDYYEFCSWKCLIKKLKTIKTNYFVSLPFLHYEKDIIKGQGYKDFLALLKG